MGRIRGDFIELDIDEDLVGMRISHHPPGPTAHRGEVSKDLDLLADETGRLGPEVTRLDQDKFTRRARLGRDGP